MKGDLVLGCAVGGLSDVLFEARAVVGEVGRTGDGFGGRVLFVGEEGEASAGGFNIMREAGDERTNFRLEVDVGHSISRCRFVLREVALETVIILVESLFAIPVYVQGFNVGWDLFGFVVVNGGAGEIRALRRVDAYAASDFADAGGAGDGFDVVLGSGVDIHRRSELFLGDLREDERAAALAGHGWLGVAIVAGRRRGLVVRHGTWLHVGAGSRNFSEVVYRGKVEAGGRQSKFKIFTSGSRLELKVGEQHVGSFTVPHKDTGYAD